MPERDDENFILRWSRRKRGVAGEADTASRLPQPDTPAPSQEDNAQPSAENAALDPSIASKSGEQATDQETAEPVPADLEGVDIDALDYDSDYTKFLQDGVPEALKRRALRQLWRSNPILANVDGLNDYDDDFSDAALAVDVLKTLHKVGRGYLSDDDGEGLDDDDLDGINDPDDDDQTVVAEREAVPEDADLDNTGPQTSNETDVADDASSPDGIESV